ncbi:hypothetical protein SAMN05216459_11245 [Ensifer sp. OV372]|nr:hypothetical protein SAMN05216459_11245 [Ensifer sp. OV372]
MHASATTFQRCPTAAKRKRLLQRRGCIRYFRDTRQISIKQRDFINKGESCHALPVPSLSNNSASCAIASLKPSCRASGFNLVVNAVILWNTV